MNINKTNRTLWIIMAIIFLVAIFIQSNMPYRNQDIKPFLEEMVVLKEIPITFTYNHRVISGYEPYEFWEFIIRKAGHVFQYSILTFILIKVLSFIAARLFIVLFLSFILSFMIALFDEWRQRFSEGRTGQLIDVITFDLLGIMIAIFCFWLAERHQSKKGKDTSDKTQSI